MKENKPAHQRPTPEGILTERDAARYLCVSVYALRQWRTAGRGPDFARLGRLIRYRLDALDSYMTAHTIRRRENE